MSKRKFLTNWIAVGVAAALLVVGCGQNNVVVDANVDNPVVDENSSGTDISTELPITIVYTNDVHSHIDNTKTNENEEEVPGLRYSTIAKMVQDMKDEGREVLLVDAGDEVSGCGYGSYDEGESIIGLMNAAGYDIATLGNHEFDYGMFQMFKLTDSAEYPYITCNFHCLDESMESEPFEPYKIVELGGKKIAFVGVTTPEAITSSTPTYFQNEQGEFIYVIDGQDDPNDMFETVQATIDEIRDDVDYVIGLGHVGIGIDEQRNHVSSYDLIANVSGFNAFIDGHSHSLDAEDWVEDKDGNMVLLTQTGSYLATVGVMEISADGTFSAKLVSEFEGQDPEVAKLEDELIKKIDDLWGEKIASLDTKLYDSNPDDDRQRLVRAQETNLGDFTADAFYWYFNESAGLDCDIAIQNGGGIRTYIDAGDVTLGDVKNTSPFGNMLCLVSASGQQIKDALELGATVAGEWDVDNNMPAENGGFLQVAGLRYTIDTTIPCSVVVDNNGLFVSVDGEYRVRDIEVYNREKGIYEPLDLEKQYNVSGQNFNLRNNGNGLSMFAECEMVVDYAGQDYDILIDYMKSFTKTGESCVVNTENSPLSAYENYQLDYENPAGAGRISIIME